MFPLAGANQAAPNRCAANAAETRWGPELLLPGREENDLTKPGRAAVGRYDDEMIFIMVNDVQFNDIYIYIYIGTITSKYYSTIIYYIYIYLFVRTLFCV